MTTSSRSLSHLGGLPKTLLGGAWGAAVRHNRCAGFPTVAPEPITVEFI
jgi:hypothetical protein